MCFILVVHLSLLHIDANILMNPTCDLHFERHHNFNRCKDHQLRKGEEHTIGPVLIQHFNKP